MEDFMGLMDRIKKVTGTNDNYDDSYDDDYYGGFEAYDDVEDDGDVQMAGTTTIGTSTVGGQMSGISLSGSNIKMQVVRPQTYDSETASQIANHLLNKCTVVLNLENTNKETSRRLIDFLSGVAYSIGGSLKRITANTYIITASNVDIGDAQLKTQRKPEPQPEPEAAPVDDFADFN
jgi:cell division inhibitor SepF